MEYKDFVKSQCKKCGNKADYNLALNIGLCNSCIAANIEQLQADNKRLKEQNEKMKSQNLL